MSQEFQPIKKPIQKDKFDFGCYFPYVLTVIFGVAAILGFAALFSTVILRSASKTEVIKKEEIKETESVAEGKMRRKIDGLIVDADEDTVRPYAVIIENVPEAKLQAGLEKASIVYEALTESGITRLLAIFSGSNQIDVIGPVRSARPYFADWAEEYKALFFHAGGSPQALRDLKRDKYNIIDIDEIGAMGKYFWRSSKRRRPHNLFTDSDAIKKIKEDFNISSEESEWESWKFKSDAADKERGDVDKITISYSIDSFFVEYLYEKDNNEYLRFHGLKPHTTLSGRQLKANNIIVQFVKTEVIDSEGRREMDTIGSGDAIIFLDGKAIEGKWERIFRSDRTRFYDNNDNEIKFNAGITWVEIVPSNMKSVVSY